MSKITLGVIQVNKLLAHTQHNINKVSPQFMNYKAILVLMSVFNFVCDNKKKFMR